MRRRLPLGWAPASLPRLALESDVVAPTLLRPRKHGVVELSLCGSDLFFLGLLPAADNGHKAGVMPVRPYARCQPECVVMRHSLCSAIQQWSTTATSSSGESWAISGSVGGLPPLCLHLPRQSCLRTIPVMTMLYKCIGFQLLTVHDACAQRFLS